MKICCDCVHFKRVDNDHGLCKCPIPVWVTPKSNRLVNQVTDGDGMNCQAFEENLLLYVKELRMT